MTRLVFTAVCMLLAGCAFRSNRPLFNEADAAQPFEDGAIVRLAGHPGSGDIDHLQYRLRGRAYDLAPPENSDEPVRVLFVPVVQTPEDDYIAQMEFEQNEDIFAYGFVWRHGDGYRIMGTPGPLEESDAGRRALSRHCSVRPNNECALASREAVVNLYLEGVYGSFVLEGRAFHGMAEQVPLPAGKSGAPQ